ncbi:hypothetical protein A2716_00940 [candidate division WWE3 bacterium RIFCSPHIGHO2_01_FULL_40_23]|uniref:Uncharacterized protein n=1 Tax=candidate division WWE3 bacterium RIFCSPLOWO2_01_FULL_41_18 TaxID=1802625 RepID=A0A1F4VEE0_UNCKA|nr:MAG: hypothetical protein A2716_00940 [candidate division WWE3 bacterium RIFCSPHIGHO2_01_FULL_40_23]OGC55557.1 MAG: hypothetical protein A3A78_01210 [candidate division WWE3 bacterium RIFCSPLOWO2_01_FULL_41_18]
MAYLTFDPSDKGLEDILVQYAHLLEKALVEGLIPFGVDEDDVIVRVLKCTTRICNKMHIKVTLETDNPAVTADAVTVMLRKVLTAEPFEVSRIFVGDEGDWASNYE